MTHWLIARTDTTKEFAVAEALRDLGHAAWVPTYVAVAYERFTAGPGITLRRKKPIERPLMPSVLFIPYLGLPSSYIPAVRYMQGFWTDCFEIPRLVPDRQLLAFRERVEAVNAAEIARIRKAQLGKRKGKRTVKLDPNLAEELKSLLFGEQAQEAA
jgi:hypothetical protein